MVALSGTWDDTLNIPAVAAAVSALFFVLTLLRTHSSTKTHVSGQDGQQQQPFTRMTEQRNVASVVAFKTVRLLGISGLISITAYQNFAGPRVKEVPHVSIRLAVTYASVSRSTAYFADRCLFDRSMLLFWHCFPWVQERALVLLRRIISLSSF